MRHISDHQRGGRIAAVRWLIPPIYWLFSLGKQKAFECLVYLHRFTENTLAEMRIDYVIPLTTKLTSYIEKLGSDKDDSHSAADQRISLDLDDEVKVNYGKFGDLLAEVKQVARK